MTILREEQAVVAISGSTTVLLPQYAKAALSTIPIAKQEIMLPKREFTKLCDHPHAKAQALAMQMRLTLRRRRRRRRGKARARRIRREGKKTKKRRNQQAEGCICFCFEIKITGCWEMGNKVTVQWKWDFRKLLRGSWVANSKK